MTLLELGLVVHQLRPGRERIHDRIPAADSGLVQQDAGSLLALQAACGRTAGPGRAVVVSARRRDSGVQRLHDHLVLNGERALLAEHQTSSA